MNALDAATLPLASLYLVALIEYPRRAELLVFGLRAAGQRMPVGVMVSMN